MSSADDVYSLLHCDSVVCVVQQQDNIVVGNDYRISNGDGSNNGGYKLRDPLRTSKITFRSNETRKRVVINSERRNISIWKYFLLIFICCSPLAPITIIQLVVGAIVVVVIVIVIPLLSKHSCCRINVNGDNKRCQYKTKLNATKQTNSKPITIVQIQMMQS